MKELFIVAGVAVIVGSTFDGLSTSWFRHVYPGEWETNPVLGKYPSDARIFLTGAVYVALLLGIMMLTHSIVFACLNLIICGVHLYAGFQNFRSNEVTPLALFGSWSPK